MSARERLDKALSAYGEALDGAALPSVVTAGVLAADIDRESDSIASELLDLVITEQAIAEARKRLEARQRELDSSTETFEKLLAQMPLDAARAQWRLAARLKAL